MKDVFTVDQAAMLMLDRMMGMDRPRETIILDRIRYPFGRPPPRRHDAHIRAWYREVSRRLELARLAAQAELERPIIEAAEAKRARRNAKRAADRNAAGY